jgi:hypothetical protein
MGGGLQDMAVIAHKGIIAEMARRMCKEHPVRRLASWLHGCIGVVDFAACVLSIILARSSSAGDMLAAADWTPDSDAAVTQMLVNDIAGLAFEPVLTFIMRLQGCFRIVLVLEALRHPQKKLRNPTKKEPSLWDVFSSTQRRALLDATLCGIADRLPAMALVTRTIFEPDTCIASLCTQLQRHTGRHTRVFTSDRCVLAWRGNPKKPHSPAHPTSNVHLVTLQGPAPSGRQRCLLVYAWLPLARAHHSEPFVALAAVRAPCQPSWYEHCLGRVVAEVGMDV